MKKAIILFNLGGPDKLENVQPFLFNLFNDPAILNLPTFLRYPLAKLISNRRAPIAKKIYQELGGSSPILKLTNEQAEALEAKLNNEESASEYKCFVVMRCWHPRAEEVINDVKNYEPDEVILMPLYPQFSAATSGSSIKEWEDVCKLNNFKTKTSTICCYPTDENFIFAHKEEILKITSDLKNYKLIFSAHGLPEKNIKKGDPYQWQVEQSVKKIIESLNIKNYKRIQAIPSVMIDERYIPSMIPHPCNGLTERDIKVKNKRLSKNSYGKYLRNIAANNEKDF